MNDDTWITTGEAGRLLGVHPDTVRRWIRAGRLDSWRPGKWYKVRQAQVRELATGGGGQ